MTANGVSSRLRDAMTATWSDAASDPMLPSPVRRPKGKKALQKLAKDYPPSALPFRYLVRCSEPALVPSGDLPTAFSGTLGK